MTTQNHNPNSGTGRLRAKLAMGIVALGCAATLALGGIGAQGDRLVEVGLVAAASSPITTPCIFADQAGVPGTGCGGATLAALSVETPCAYASQTGVPGESCAPARATIAPAAPCPFADIAGVPGEGCVVARP